MGERTFDPTEEHLALRPALRFGMDRWGEVSSADPKRPDGAMTCFTLDRAEHLGIALPGSADGCATMPDDLARRLTRLHHEMQPALQVFLRQAELAPGRFRHPEGTIGWEPA